MSNQLYSYLAKKIFDYFQKKGIKKGERFNITLETKEKTENMYKALFLYKSNLFIFENYKTFSIKFNEYELIIAATVNNVTEDYLTRLRNLIVSDEKKFDFFNKAILFIHNSTLDSIINGSESLSKKKMPLNIEEIKKDIKENAKDFEDKDKEIINFTIDKLSKDKYIDNNSVFEYEKILDIIEKKQIEEKDYIDLGLFIDKEINTFKGKELKERISQNAEFFSKISTINQYGNPDDELNNLFGDDNLIKKLKKEDWKTNVDFNEILKSNEKKQKDSVLNYIESSIKSTKENIIHWDNPDGNTKAKSRKRNIIIFNPDNLQNINLELKFDDYLKKEYLLKPKINDNITLSGKKLNININCLDLSKKIIVIKFGNDKQKYDFKIVVLNIPEMLIKELKSKYVLNIEGKNNGFWTEIKNISNELIINKSENFTVIEKYISTETEYFIEFENITVETCHGKSLQRKNDVTFDLKIDINQTLKLIFSDDCEEELKIKIKYNDEIIPIFIKKDKEIKTEITSFDIWKLKREKKDDFTFNLSKYSEENNIIVFQEKEYYAKKTLMFFLLLEQEIINNGSLYFERTNKYDLKPIELKLSQNLILKYKEIINYFKTNNTIPSFCYLKDELLNLYKDYINLYFDELYNNKGKQFESTIIKIGTIKTLDNDKEIFTTPLHPLNIAYQILLHEKINNDKFKDESLSNNIIKNFKSGNLLPYIYYNKDTLYRVFEENTIFEWNIYVKDNLNRYNSSRDFIAKLFKNKIDEFTQHFSYLFNINQNAPLKINLVNMGDCKEIIQGVFNYYCDKLNNSDLKPENLLPVEIYIYSEIKELTYFERISFLKSAKEVNDKSGITFKAENYTDEDILEIYRNKVHFYKKNNNDIEYSHLTFFEMDKSSVENTYEDVRKLNTGISFNGIFSNVVPMFTEKSYKTGFGLNGSYCDNILLKTAKRLNEIARVSEKQDPFEENKVIVTAVSEKNSKKTDEIYNKSHWVTFIEPKVDINFFKENEDNDLLIIHYSDQYTNSSGYDAITVTKKSKLYQTIIYEFLNLKLKDSNINFSNISKNLINYFNAINGDWLLKLTMNNNEAQREKISILSAINLLLAFLNQKHTIWVPVSLEELLRITGSAGLSQTDGILSAKNLGIKGSCSDDLLMIGIENNNDEIFIHIYPVEVKIGINQNNVLEKAVEQGEKTYNVFSEIFITESFKNIFYRNFLMQILIIKIEKLKLYEIGNVENWNYLLNTETKQKLLNNNYKFSQSFENELGKFGVISFKKDKIFRSSPKKTENNYTIIEFTENDGYLLLSKTIDEIKSLYLNITDEIMINNYHIEQKAVQNDEIEEKIKKSQNNISEIKIKFGKELNNSDYFWYPNNTNKIMHPNTGIIGTMGTGKTQFTKSIITQLYRSFENNNESKFGILIFDYKGDYIKKDFVDAVNAKIFTAYHLPFNPLALFKGKNPKPLLPLHTGNTIKETISKSFKLGAIQENTLNDIIIEAYQNNGIDKNIFSSWNNDSPTLNDAYNLYKSKSDFKKDSLYSALKKICEFEIFTPHSKQTLSLYDLIDGVVVIDLSQYEQDIQNLIVALTLDIFYSQMQTKGHSNIDKHLREITKIILVDEADNFLSQNFNSIKKILKEGREFGVGTILSTQFLNHFSTNENEYSDYIETWIVHKVAKMTGKEARNIFGANNKGEEDEYINKITELEKHFSLIKAGNNPVKHIKDYSFFELIIR